MLKYQQRIRCQSTVDSGSAQSSIERRNALSIWWEMPVVTDRGFDGWRAYNTPFLFQVLNLSRSPLQLTIPLMKHTIYSVGGSMACCTVIKLASGGIIINLFSGIVRPKAERSPGIQGRDVELLRRECPMISTTIIRNHAPSKHFWVDPHGYCGLQLYTSFLQRMRRQTVHQRY